MAIIFSEIKGIAWVKNCMQHYPEILWLAEAEMRKTAEGITTEKSPYSEQLFCQNFIELDWAIMTIRCLQLIPDGSENAYQEFNPHFSQILETS